MHDFLFEEELDMFGSKFTYRAMLGLAAFLLLLGSIPKAAAQNPYQTGNSPYADLPVIASIVDVGNKLKRCHA